MTEQITDVAVEPADNTADVTWPTSEAASTYTLQISKDGVVFCTLIFNGNGQLTGIAFAPGRAGERHLPSAVKTSNGGLRFTVTGLSSGTSYHLTLTAKDNAEEVIVSYNADFETTGNVATDIDNIESGSSAHKIIRNGQIYILRDGKTFTVQGVELR